jgi:CoA:oxalate CoA-transferase
MTNNAPMKLLDGVLVLDLSQFLSGPFAALRLSDLGARVIKIERPDGGDLCRRLYLSDTEIGGDSTLFHAINRGKESFAADFKNKDDLAAIHKLILGADVLIQNFRPGVIERLGLDYDSVKKINPGIVYASISGYGEDGPWKALPGQDLLAQARSGLMWPMAMPIRVPCLLAWRSPICWQAMRSFRAYWPDWCAKARRE